MVTWGAVLHFQAYRHTGQMESWGNGGASLDEPMESEEYRLLELYCNTRRQQRFPIMRQGPAVNSKNQDHAQFSGKPVLMGLPVKIKRIQVPGSPLGRVTDHLVQIADSTLIHEDEYENDIESDGTDDDQVIKQLVELLKKSGDALDERFKKDKALLQKIQQSLSYNLFEQVTSSILQKLVAPRGRAATSKQQIAWAFEVTNRLSAMDIIPRRRALGFGAQYVQQYHSAWIQQQGGWDAVFSSSEDVD